jgi:Protein of unknown function (DUF3024)
MSFSDLETARIHRIVGDLCERRVPDHVKGKVRLTYTIGNQQVVISEERKLRDGSPEWVVLEIAKLRYLRARNEWQLYWKRSSGKWWPYEPRPGAKTLAATIKEIDLDSHGCFFG